MLRLAHAPSTPMQPSPDPPPLDFALLQQTLPGQTPRNRRALWWMLGFLVLVVASVVALVLYLSAFEDEEEERRRVRGRPWPSTVATPAQTMRWAISTKTGAT